MADYQIRLKDEGEWKQVTRWELRRRLSKCVLDVEGTIGELDAGKLFRSGFGTFRKRPAKRKGSATRRLF
ncbi:MAG: hypothetical protein R3E76_10695 [Planctomycetota bacterium]